MLHGFSVINIHYLGLKRTGGSAKIHFTTFGGGKQILIVNGKKDMAQSDQPSYTLKNLGAEGQLSPPVSARQNTCNIHDG